MGDVEGLDAVEARGRRSARAWRAPRRRRSTSQNGCAQTATPPAPWISSIASLDGRRLALAEGRPALDQVGDEERRGLGQLLALEPRRVVRVRRPPPGPGAGGRSSARGRARVQQRRRPRPSRSARAPRSSAARAASRSPRERASCSSSGCVRRIDQVAADVQVGGGGVEDRDLDAGDQRDADARRRRRPPPSTPSTLSWSVSASSSTPAAWAAPTTAAGASSPSEWVEWLCRSKVGGCHRAWSVLQQAQHRVSAESQRADKPG